MDKLKIIVRESAARVVIKEKTSRVEVRQIGSRGLDGLSAYEVWLSLGNTGTEQDFFDSLGNVGLTKEQADTYYSQLGHTHTASEITDFNTVAQSLIDNSINQLESEISTQIDTLNTAITDETNRATTAEQSLQNQINQLTGVDGDYDTRLDNLELGLNTTNTNLQAEIDRATNAESQLENSITNLSIKEQNDVDNLQSQINEIVLVNNNQNSSIDSINNTITDIYTDIDTLNAKNIEQDTRLDNIDNSITTINGDITAVENKNLEQDGRLDSLETNLAITNTAISDETTRATNAENNLQSQIDSVVLVNSTQDGQISNLQSQIDVLNGIDNDYDTRLDNLETGLTAVENKNLEQDTRLDGIDAELLNKANKGDNTDITSLSGITGGISTVDYIDFNTLPIAAIQEARVRWNEADGTLEIGLKGGNVVLQVGQEQVTMVQNDTGSNMFEGQAVYLQGSTGNNLNVLLAQANSEQKSSKTFGVLTENINHNNKGFVTTSGLVRNINTLNLTQGAAIWLDPNTPGGLTTTKPVAPNHLVLVGWCVRQHETVGSIFVHVQNGYELEELHNVLITALQNGDILSYNATTGLWENKQIDFSAIETNIANLQAEVNQVESDLADEITRATTAENNIIQDLVNNYMPITRTYTLEELTDVNLQNLENGNVLKYNGTAWYNDNGTVAVQETFTATEGQTQFLLENETFGSSVLTVNGIQIAYGIDYTTTGNLLEFAYPLQLDDYVIITYGISYTSFPLDNSITAGVQTRAPSQDAVYNALLLKADINHTHTVSQITDYTTATQSLIDVEVTRATNAEQNLQNQITALSGVDGGYDTRLDNLESGLTAVQNKDIEQDSRLDTIDSNITTINNTLSNKADIGHTHTVSDITDYTTATQSLIDIKASELETQFGNELDIVTDKNNEQDTRLNGIDSSITSINSSLANKADINHTHTVSQITDYTTATQSLIDSSITTLRNEVGLELDAIVAVNDQQDLDIASKADINHNHDGVYLPVSTPVVDSNSTSASLTVKQKGTGDLLNLLSSTDGINYTLKLYVNKAGFVGFGGQNFDNSYLMTAELLPTASVESYAFRYNHIFPKIATSNQDCIRSTPIGESSSTSYTVTNVSHFRAQQYTLGTNQIITNNYGFHAGAALTSGINNYGFYSNLSSSNNRWNFYANGTAPNYFEGDIRTNRVVLKSTTVTTSNIDATLTTTALISGIRTADPTTNITLTVPTGTNMDLAFQNLQNNQSFEWVVINLNTTVNTVTIGSNTDHTVVGNMIVQPNTSVRFLTRKTATNTFITYRVS